MLHGRQGPQGSQSEIRPLLSARLEAERALIEYLRTADIPQEHPWVEIRHRLEDLALRRFTCIPRTPLLYLYQYHLYDLQI